MMFLRLITLFLSLFPLLNCTADEYISVYKKNVLHNFVRNEKTDAFATHVFENWENETFEIFDQVKDPNGIAIDLGAWIGTTSIWLSKNFHHVISVEADPEAVICLQENLKASDCQNVSICKQPILDAAREVVFGPLGEDLNESISTIKQSPNNKNDFLAKSITFKQLVFDYAFAEETLAPRNISFIKCDIEGGEEYIIEDLLYFAYHNKCKIYLSFHLDWWKNHTIEDFRYLFKFFKTNCKCDDVCEYIQRNPFSSLLFEPIEGAGTMVKKNIPALIIGYNLYSYIKKMTQQLEKYTNDIIIVDNSSSFPPLLDYYEKEFGHTLLRQKTNSGHVVYLKDAVQKLVGDVYLLTDPDILFNPNLPDNFIEELLEISEHFSAYKTGFALCIDAKDIRTDIPIREAEIGFWGTPLEYPKNKTLKLYEAPIDTTFCLVNKKFYNHENEKIGIFNSIRVAGDFTCFHLPWHKNFFDYLEPGEFDFYLNGNISTHYFSKSIEPSDDKIYYDQLAVDPWTDHVKSFQQLFDLQKINSFLEFGVGRATQFFLDHCDQVTSIELVVENRRGNIEPWYEKCLDLFRYYQNWKPSIHHFSSLVDEADQRAHLQLDPEFVDGSYIDEIQELFDHVFNNKHFDLAFVDPGILIRGDLVNALFGRADIIVAHDTACTVHKMYGYYKIKCPETYVELASKYGSGTTFWIKKEKTELILKLIRVLPELCP